ncbi:SDR family NAD(P)-dependent oxidoreductase [Acetobacter nitrogenifigens]|uniref:SDR family NAD(P)-dependent oxidoreductase n=1 Tax=Acetobacter nitrogenifigens TaxID=285268 RepID=UPI000424AB52|nr:SDR family NAD(P)-dependent oxidoreductase [Acetobacter nitrogenifigens]
MRRIVRKLAGAGFYTHRPSVRAILITGASSGIGAALARFYAAPHRTLMLWGRDEARLGEVAAACRAGGATVLTRAVDLADGVAALAAFREDDAATPFDLVALSAGLGDMKRASDQVERAEAVFRLGVVNYATPAALTMAAAERMRKRGGGSIGLIGSVGAFHDVPFAAGYGGSKAGLARFASSARIALAPLGVRVTLIAPGFVDTAMSRKLIGPRPFLVSADDAARRIAKALGAGRAELVFPWPFRLLRRIDQITPRPLADALMRRLKADQQA